MCEGELRERIKGAKRDASRGVIELLTYSAASWC